MIDRILVRFEQLVITVGFAAATLLLFSNVVARYVFDLDDWNKSAWVVPLGASGHPGSPHYADQAPVWGQVEVIPMLYERVKIAEEAECCQKLNPLRD